MCIRDRYWSPTPHICPYDRIAAHIHLLSSRHHVPRRYHRIRASLHEDPETGYAKLPAYRQYPVHGLSLIHIFRGGIVRHRRDRIGCHSCRDIQDIAFCCLYHRQEGLCQHDNGTHVDGEYLVVFVDFHRCKRGDGCPSGIIDKNVETTVPFSDSTDDSAYPCLLYTS